MQVTLVDPFVTTKKFNTSSAHSLNLGIGYLAAFLRENGHEVRIIDAVAEGHDRIGLFKGTYTRWGLTAKEILDRTPRGCGLFGISANHSCLHNAYLEILKEARETLPKAAIALGGVHANELPEEFLEAGADYVIQGEGEMSLLALCDLLDGKGRSSDLKGISWLEGGKRVTRPGPWFVEDLDSLPFPARDLFPLEKYFEMRAIHSPANGPHTPILSSRGCPQRCHFCSIPLFWTDGWRGRRPDAVVEEMVHCTREYGIREFHFMDDNMTASRERTLVLCAEIKKRCPDASWYASTGLRSENLDAEVLAAMKGSGCRLIALSPESGSRRVLAELYGKPLDLDHIRDVVAMADRLGIATCAYFVVGCKGETEDDRRHTARYVTELARNGLDEMGVFVLMAQANTKVSRDLYGNTKNVSEWEDLVQGTVPVSHADYRMLSRYKLGLYLRLFLIQVFFRPGKIARLLVDCLTGIQRTKTDRALYFFVRVMLLQVYPRALTRTAGALLGRLLGRDGPSAQGPRGEPIGSQDRGDAHGSRGREDRGGVPESMRGSRANPPSRDLPGDARPRDNGA